RGSQSRESKDPRPRWAATRATPVTSSQISGNFSGCVPVAERARTRECGRTQHNQRRGPPAPPTALGARALPEQSMTTTQCHLSAVRRIDEYAGIFDVTNTLVVTVDAEPETVREALERLDLTA